MLVAVGLVMQLEHGNIERCEASPVQPGQSGLICSCAVSIVQRVTWVRKRGLYAEQDDDEAKGVAPLL